MPKRALVYQLKQISGDDHERYEREMVGLGQMWGYDIVRRLVIPTYSDTPLVTLISNIQRNSAAAVFVPTLDHLSNAMRAVTLRCALVDTSTSTTYQRGHQWPEHKISAALTPDHD
ncbi:hypothetical protein ACFVMC_15285 [Nocardia sp. NPDC127579]|uniref:hypothetical protein n=1 Tax=Nocardia sp. NPDC127579 TaxID=3345402 RepID=UPI0036359669